MRSSGDDSQLQIERAEQVLRTAVRHAREMTRGRKGVDRWVVLRVHIDAGEVTPRWTVEPARLGPDVVDVDDGCKLKSEM